MHLLKRSLTASAVALALSARRVRRGVVRGRERGRQPLGLQQPGTLRAGTLTDAPPNVFLKDGKFTGFDNDLLTAVAGKLGLKVEFVGTEFSSLLAQVEDPASSTSAPRRSASPRRRKKTVDFTNRYDFGFLGLDVPKGSGITSFDQLAGKRVVVVQGTVQDDYATPREPQPGPRPRLQRRAEPAARRHRRRVDHACRDR